MVWQYITLPVDLLGEVVSAVAEKKGVSEDDLPMLYGSIEPDALEELFEHAHANPDADVLIQFSYAGLTVTIDDLNDVTVEE